MSKLGPASRCAVEGCGHGRSDASCVIDFRLSSSVSIKTRGGKDSDTIALEKRVSDALGLKVSVDHHGEGGVLHIHYRDLDQLDAVLKKLERN